MLETEIVIVAESAIFWRDVERSGSNSVHGM